MTRAAVALDIANPDTWPVRMTRAEFAAVLRVSRVEFWRRAKAGRIPAADDGHTWSRDAVRRFVGGDMKAYERSATQRARRQQLSVVGGGR